MSSVSLNSSLGAIAAPEEPSHSPTSLKQSLSSGSLREQGRDTMQAGSANRTGGGYGLRWLPAPARQLMQAIMQRDDWGE